MTGLNKINVETLEKVTGGKIVTVESGVVNYANLRLKPGFSGKIAGKVYNGGTDASKTFDGFTPGKNGYTVEARVKVDNASKNFYPFATTDKGVGFKGYVSSTDLGLYNGENTYVSNESLGSFHNTDGEYHTYRYAVTPDERVIVYRDGITVDTIRVADLALQSEWCVGNGEVVENLLKNPGFEGEYDFRSSVVARIEGWDVYPYDQYNSYQDIDREGQPRRLDGPLHVGRRMG